ncbi:MAG: hypothetical protein PHS49_02280 [Candidatus Gracilibacteria bacterium]|nr:hypothetical protein [Candidatus Gracilibacteria bacterium]
MPEKIIQTKSCKNCNSSFYITDSDLQFYEKVSPIFACSSSSSDTCPDFSWKGRLGGGIYLIPAPTLCPDCRAQRRLSFLNQRSLYKNVCLNCKKDIVSRFHIESGIKNYCNECWSSEDWNQLEFGVDIDFTKSMFEQFGELIKNTIFQNMIGSSSNVTNNSVYTSHTSEIVDSYYVFEANTINSSLFSFGIKNCDYTVDCNFVGNSKYVYECVDSYDMYNSFYCNKSFGCKFSYFLDNCYNCSHCIGCSNLNNKTYHVFNNPVTKLEYENIKNNLGNYSFLVDFSNKYKEFLTARIVKNLNLVGSENCLGDNIINSKNCINCYDVLECTDCKYSANINYSSDLFDISSYGEESNRMYESVSVGRYSNNILFSSIVGKGENLIYCIEVKKSKNCFLCVNLEGKQYCILNKQYTKEEYEKLVPKIIEHMIDEGDPTSPRFRGTGWGEFFPSSISPFGYNETVAMEYFPIPHPNPSDQPHHSPLLGEEREQATEIVLHPSPSKEKELRMRFNWSDYQSPFPKVEKIIPASKLPDSISDIPDDILNWAIECEITKKPFRILKQELEFYRKHNLPIPKRHPDQRHLDRMSLRNPRKLFDRKCDKCRIDIKTSYSPDRKEIVYCEDCYNKEIY